MEQHHDLMMWLTQQEDDVINETEGDVTTHDNSPSSNHIQSRISREGCCELLWCGEIWETHITMCLSSPPTLPCTLCTVVYSGVYSTWDTSGGGEHTTHNIVLLEMSVQCRQWDSARNNSAATFSREISLLSESLFYTERELSVLDRIQTDGR